MGEQEPFEKIRHRDENGKEYWKARELAVALGYSDYRNFKAVMEKAKVLCLQNGHQPEDHFVDFTEMVELGSGSKRSIADCRFSRLFMLLSENQCIKLPCPANL